jgi:predicted membrane protein
MEMAKIMATMAAKTPNEMFETAIFLYLFLLCYYQKTLSLSKKKKKRLRKREREREETENIGKIRNQYAKNGAECRGTWEWYLY